MSSSGELRFCWRFDLPDSNLDNWFGDEDDEFDSTNDTDDSAEATDGTDGTGVFIPSQLSEEEYVLCTVCGRCIILYEQGGYCPLIHNYICYYNVDWRCQEVLKEIHHFMSDIEKAIILRHSVCDTKREKRRCYLRWCTRT